MSTRQALDALVARALIEKRLISEAALAHALAVQRRGFERSPIDEILVELELLSAESLVAALSAITGAPIWDGESVDAELASAVRPARLDALPVRRDGSTVFYATTAPHDEGLREDLRFALGALRVEPLVATSNQIAAGRASLFEGQPPAGVGATVARRSQAERDAQEAELRARWQSEAGDPDPVVRLANLLLLEYPFRWLSGALRVEATESPVVRGGNTGLFDAPGKVLSIPPTVVQAILWRYKLMAALPPGRLSAGGSIQIRSSTTHRNFFIHVEPTERGDVALVQRCLPWHGSELPPSHEWSAHRSALEEGWRAQAEDRNDRFEYARRAALRTAESIGDAAIVDQLASVIQLATFLDEERRENEARPLVARAFELARGHQLGGRVLGEIEGLAGYVEIDDLARRVGHFERAEAIFRAPGPARRVTTPYTLEIARAESALGRHERALAAAERAVEDERRWFGGTTLRAVDGLCLGAVALARLERAEQAERSAEEALAFARALDCEDESPHWALGSAALCRRAFDRAVEELTLAQSFQTADSLHDPSWAGIALDLSRAHEGLGQLERARAVALAARELPHSVASAAAHRALEELLRRAGPYR